MKPQSLRPPAWRLYHIRAWKRIRCGVNLLLLTPARLRRPHVAAHFSNHILMQVAQKPLDHH